MQCWRCRHEDDMVHDPMQMPSDKIGVCRPCAVERGRIMHFYAVVGRKINIEQPPDDRVVA